jgi:hypothetical protein
MARPNRSHEVLAALRDLAAQNPGALSLPKTKLAALLGQSTRQLYRQLAELERAGELQGLGRGRAGRVVRKQTAPLVLAEKQGEAAKNNVTYYVPLTHDNVTYYVPLTVAAINGTYYVTLNGDNVTYRGVNVPYYVPLRTAPSFSSLPPSYSPPLISSTPPNLRSANSGVHRKSDPEAKTSQPPRAKKTVKQELQRDVPGIGVCRPDAITREALAGKITPEQATWISTTGGPGSRAFRQALREGIKLRFRGQYLAHWARANGKSELEAERWIDGHRWKKHLSNIVDNIVELGFTVEHFLEVAEDSRPPHLKITSLSYLGSGAFLERARAWVPPAERVEKGFDPSLHELYKPTPEQIARQRANEDPLYWEDDPDDDLDAIIDRCTTYVDKLYRDGVDERPAAARKAVH